MLAPPPEGTFDIEDAELSIKRAPAVGASDQVQVPLLAYEDLPEDSNNSRVGKVSQQWICIP